MGRAPHRSLMGADSAETFHGFLVDKRRKHDMIVQELNHSGVDQDEYPPDSCEESRRMVQGGEEAHMPRMNASCISLLRFNVLYTHLFSLSTLLFTAIFHASFG